MDFQSILTEIKPLILETGEFIRHERTLFSNERIEYKGVANMVSYVDKTAEEKLVEGLARILPDAGFVTEEGTINKTGERYDWIIDPLDGTTNFIHGFPPFSISVALRDRQEIVLGVVYEITRDEFFSSVKGGAAHLNEHPIRVSTPARLENSLLVTGFPYDHLGKLEEWLRLFRKLTETTHGVRRLGSAAVDLAYVACGRIDGFYEYNLNAWDVAAGAFIVQQAGGKVSDFSGSPEFIQNRTLLASNGLIQEELLQLIRENF
ncbi:myo-inositol-1(or 4)-monophosphatase [Anseongella ginsenosidimutans]|uniref:Inositol-1-monophosphatase n=1 Tax=Anseongella ginsenosidimutans TaxID=496056 RepID=A0A4R3KQ89_9SPHI|nr:inositol monophosphatase family protein [Anseongella ginsenosidimutans]QEC53646.1 inositol monophosphatase [Anseongella ginsenosidimutans]TCS86106.1 myo-inositol-1(or 4)-monophosphatase [Anseongella ginsenosidimutans]